MEWRERLPLDFGRWPAPWRGRPGIASARRHGLRLALILVGLTFFRRLPARIRSRARPRSSAADGYARLVLKLAEDVHSEVTTAGSILVIPFKQPVDIPVDKLSDAVPDYVGSARRDPDGTAIRLSLARRVTINTMTAGERVFVDLLPDTWTGPPPSLPQDVIRELAERARAAERALRQQRAEAEAKKRPPIRVRTSVQPTFVRFVFEMPDGVGVSSVLNDQKLTLLFNAVLTFDLADAKEAAPPNVASINQKTEGDATAVEIALIGDVDVHSFREDKNYVIDVAFQQAEKPSALAVAGGGRLACCRRQPLPAPAAPACARAAPAAAPAGRPRRRVREAGRVAPASQQSGEIVPPTSETFAKQANIEIKPETAPKISPARRNAAKPEPPAKETPAAPSRRSRRKRRPLAASEAAGRNQAAAGGRSRRQRRRRRRHANQRGPEPDVFLRRRRRRRHCSVAPIRCGWCSIRREPIDVEPIRSKGGSIIADVSRLPLDKGQAIRIRLNRPQMPSLIGRRSGRRRELDADTSPIRCERRPQPLVAHAQRHRSRACQCHRAAGEARPAASAGRSGRRRYHHGGHGAAAGSRLHQAAGFRRVVAARIDPGRGDPSELR